MITFFRQRNGSYRAYGPQVLRLFDLYKEFNWYPVEKFCMNADQIGDFINRATKVGLEFYFTAQSDYHTEPEIADYTARAESEEK